MNYGKFLSCYRSIDNIVLTDQDYIIKVFSCPNILTPSALMEMIVPQIISSKYLFPLQDVQIDSDQIQLIFTKADHDLQQETLSSLESVKETARRTLLGLIDMREKGCFHLDIKPENILMQQGRSYLCDFGLASLMQAEVVGIYPSVPYIAPENILGAAVTAATDIWSFGVTLAELIIASRVGEFKRLFPLGQLKEITALIGKIKSWEGIEELEEYQFQRKYFGKRAPSRNNLIKKWQKIFPMKKEEIDFVLWILNPNPHLRPNLSQILQHPWLDYTGKITPLRPFLEIIEDNRAILSNDPEIVSMREELLRLAHQKYIFREIDQLSFYQHLLDKILTVIQPDHPKTYLYPAFIITQNYHGHNFHVIPEENTRECLEEILIKLDFSFGFSTSYHLLNYYQAEDKMKLLFEEILKPTLIKGVYDPKEICRIILAN